MNEQIDTGQPAESYIPAEILTELFAVRDRKAEQYQAPFTMQNIALAVRAFEGGTKDPKSAFCEYPNDFELCHLGQFNLTSGEVTTFERPRFIVLAQTLIAARDAKLPVLPMEK